MKKKTVTDKGKKAGEYLWNYAKMTGLFPEFKDKKIKSRRASEQKERNS